MKLQARFTPSALLLSLSIGLVAGCGGEEPPATDNGQSGQPATGQHAEAQDPHDVPLTDEEQEQLRQETATWPAALQHIQSFRDAIQQETTQGLPARAHRALDKLDLVLERLPEIAADSNVPREQWETVTTTAQQLRDQFNQVHANIDAGEAPNYEAVAAEIDRGIETLAAIQPETAGNMN